jgi:uncharacterized protein (TIGR02145 family)
MKKKIFKLSLIALFINVGLSNIVNAQTVTDYEGNVYNTVTIGTQIWMKENLKSKKYNDGTDITLVMDSIEWTTKTTGSYCFYNNDEMVNKDLYGALYNYYAVSTGKLCPTGWHVPSKDEWTALLDYLAANGYNYDGTFVSNKVAIAMSEFENWGYSTGMGCVGNPSYQSMHNSSGFSARPGGFRYGTTPIIPSSYMFVTMRAMWWASDSMQGMAYLTMIDRYNPVVTQTGNLPTSGLSCRCLSDNSANINDVNDNIEFNVYPNPTTERINIEWDSNNEATLQVINILGEIIFENKFTRSMGLELLGKGIYFIKIIDGSSSITKKIVVE